MKRNNKRLSYIFALCAFSVGFVHASPPKRLISLVPSLTDIIFKLGAEDSLVGVSQYCRQNGREIPTVGGLYDVDLEHITSLKPDLVLMIKDHNRIRSKLSGLGINVLSLNNDSIADIYESIERIGLVLGKGTEATKFTERLREEIHHISSKKRACAAKVLITIGLRSFDSLLQEKVYVAGGNTIYNEILDTLHIDNVAHMQNGYFQTSLESISTMNPNVILNINEDFVGETSFRSTRFQKLIPNLSCFLHLEDPRHQTPGADLPVTIKVFQNSFDNICCKEVQQ